MPSYLTPEDVANRCDPKAIPTPRGFKARCPAHEDPEPSLSIDAGMKSTLVYCHAGCSLENVCTAIGITRAMLFHDYTGTDASHLDARNELTVWQRRQRPPTWEELMPPRTTQQVFEAVMPHLRPEIWAEVGVRWNDILSMDFQDAITRHPVAVIEAIAPDLMVDALDNGYDYTPDEQRRLKMRLLDVYTGEYLDNGDFG